MKRVLLFAVALVCAAQLAVSCAGKTKTKTVYLPFERGELILSVLYPQDNDEAATCGAPGSWLMWIDTAATPNGWDSSYLLGADHQGLYGCGGAGGICPDETTIKKNLAGISRVMIEGLDVMAAEYPLATTGGVNVLCRGVSDRVVREEDFVETTPPTPSESPTPAPSPSPTTGTTLNVTVRMLKVGGSNPMPFEPGSAPQRNLRFHAAASLSDPLIEGPGRSTGPQDPRGEVAIAGGRVGKGGSVAWEDRIWEFVPATLSFVHGTAFAGSPTLQAPRSGLSATATVDSAGHACVLFAGGDDSLNFIPQADATLYCRQIDGRSTASLVMPQMHAFHTATQVSSGATSHILLAGSMSIDLNEDFLLSGGNADQDYKDYGTLFTPAGSEPVNGPVCLGAFASGRFCTVVGTLPSGRGALVSARLGSSGAVTFGGVARQPDASALFTSDKGAVFRPASNAWDIPLFLITSNNEGQGASTVARITDPAVFPFSPYSAGGVPLFMSGYRNLPLETVSPRTWFVGQTIDSFEEAGSLTIGRAFAVAVSLRDHTLLVTGGRGDAATDIDGVLPVERFIPDAIPSLGTFALGSNLLVRRWGHTATRLDQTQTWLDGAVLLVGGGVTDGPEMPAELYVPAYQCAGDHRTPISPMTGTTAQPLSNATLPDFCDRNRAYEPVTDPMTGVATE